MATEKDLRIGNWILDSETDEQYFQIEQIRKYVGNDNWIYYRKGSIKCKEVEGIPLTEDILLKCGFHKDNYGIYEYVKDNAPYVSGCKILLWAKFHNDKLQLCVGRSLDNLFEIALLHYLHSLQNLFFCLCGKELEIKL